MKIGDPNKKSLKEIWNSGHRKEIMTKLNPKEHCRFHCIRHFTNIELEKFANNNDYSPEIMSDYDRFL